MFFNREEAGYLLADELKNYKDNLDAVIVTIPRGGVPVGAILAKELNLPLELVLSKKIGHPFHKEFAIGAVTIQDIKLSPESHDAPDEYIEKETKGIREVLKKRYKSYYGDRAPLSLTDKIVIMVDDGVATGNTLISCIKLIKLQQPRKIIVAIPVSPFSTLQEIKSLSEIDKTICLLTPADFYAVGQFYEDFSPVSDAEVIELLKEANSNSVIN